MNEPLRNNPIITPIPEKESTYKVHARAEYFQNQVRVYVPVEPYDKQIKGLELKNPKLKKSGPAGDRTEDFVRSVRRTRKAIKSLCLCNEFTIFATFTFATERYDIDRCKERMTNWLRNERKRKGIFEYVIVAEKHKDGALHFHALLQNYKGIISQAFKPDGNPVVQDGNPVYMIPSYTHGFTNAKFIDKERATATTIAYYLQKYITKDMPKLFGKNRYWRSKGLKTPVIQENPEPWYLAIEPDREYEVNVDDAGNERVIGRIYEFDKGTCPLIDMYIEANQP